MPEIKVLVVDDQPLMSQALAIFIDAADGMRCVGTALDGREALAQTARLLPDVVLMDMQMPGMDGVAATAEIVKLDRDIAVIGITTFEVGEYMMAALRVGARGFLLKDSQPEEVVQAVRTAHSGDLAMAPQATELLLQLATGKTAAGIPADPTTACAQAPTAREMEVLELLGHGASNKELARQLFVAETTIKAHISRLMTKFEATNRVDLVVRAVRAGLISLD